MTKIVHFESKRLEHVFKKKEAKVEALRSAFRQAREEPNPDYQEDLNERRVKREADARKILEARNIPITDREIERMINSESFQRDHGTLQSDLPPTRLVYSEEKQERIRVLEQAKLDNKIEKNDFWENHEKAQLVIKEDRVDDFIREIKLDAVGSVNEEQGCLRFDVFQDIKTPNHIFLYEVYTNLSAFQYHVTTPHFKTVSYTHLTLPTNREV